MYLSYNCNTVVFQYVACIYMVDFVLFFLAVFICGQARLITSVPKL